MLNSLVDPQSVIVRSGANVISHIAVIEIPRNEWLNLVDILAENTTYNDINVRKASILTIGNIC
jgi:importin subunit beta-1